MIVKVPGNVNRNLQRIVRITNESGTDYNSRVWVLKCELCSHFYGANGTDAWHRRCPNCQSGKPGLTIPTERDGEDWTREEHIIAFNAYNKIEFGRIHMRNPQVIELASLLARSVGSASRKLANFARLDPILQARNIRGLPHGSKGEEEVWNEFSAQPELLAFESTRLAATRLGQPIEDYADIKNSDLPPPGLEREAVVKIRVNQKFFRDRVLSAYQFRCCVTGLSHETLLTASHIIPWADDSNNRLNPRNGLCLNPLHDRAFDRYLMWVDGTFKVRFSRRLHRMPVHSKLALEWLLSFEGKELYYRILSDQIQNFLRSMLNTRLRNNRSSNQNNCSSTENLLGRLLTCTQYSLTHTSLVRDSWTLDLRLAV